MLNIVLFGPPGAGKGTQAELIKQTYQLIHISTGVVFRHNIENKTTLGEKAKNYIDKGELVPDQITIAMLKEEVLKHPKAKGFIFDGYPRTIDQANSLDQFLAQLDTSVTACIALEVGDEILINRLLERGKTSGRVDDQNEDKIRIRFIEYNKKTAVLKDFYQKQKIYHPISGVGKISEITDRLRTLIDGFAK